MLSGVGPAAHLKEHGIPVVHDLPGVGDKLADHPVVDIRFRDKTGLSLNYVKPSRIAHVFPAMKAALQYLVYGTGPFATNVCASPEFDVDKRY